VSGDPRAEALVEALKGLEPIDERERDDVTAIVALLCEPGRPFDEDTSDHVTASAFAVSELGIVLHRHRRLGIWVQPGGHIDPGEAPAAAALRELAEETGLAAVHLDPPALVHVSVHPGPLGHRHYDCRWLVAATTTTIAPQAGESSEVRWFAPEDALVGCEPDLTVGLAKALDAARRRRLHAVASWPL
jgi:8-oxo-dGTP pyrophosphatase MutT (NUDIX family)